MAHHLRSVSIFLLFLKDEQYHILHSRLKMALHIVPVIADADRRKKYVRVFYFPVPALLKAPVYQYGKLEQIQELDKLSVLPACFEKYDFLCYSLRINL